MARLGLGQQSLALTEQVSGTGQSEETSALGRPLCWVWPLRNLDGEAPGIQTEGLASGDESRAQAEAQPEAQPCGVHFYP